LNRYLETDIYTKLIQYVLYKQTTYIVGRSKTIKQYPHKMHK